MAINDFGIINPFMNMALAPPTSGSTPTIGGSDQEDMALVQQILAGLSASEKQPGVTDAILAAIPQAIAVALSPNPAEVLQGVIKEKQNENERQKERRERVKQLGAQLQIEDILGRGRERRAEAATIRQEERAGKREFASEFRASVRDVAKFNREVGFQEKMANLNFDQNKKLAEIKNGYDVENAKTAFSNSKELENLRSSNNRMEQKIGNELAFIQPLIYSKYFNGKSASDLYDKISKGGKPTPEEDKLITKAYDGMRNEKFRQELSLAQARTRGTSESPVVKGVEWAQNKASTNVLGADANGTIHELQKDMMGQFQPVDPNVKISRYLSQEETFQYYFKFYTKVHPELAGLFGQQTTELPDEKAIGIKLDDVIKTARERDKLSDAQIISNLNDPTIQQNLKVTPQQVLQAIERNKVNPQSTSTPLAPMKELSAESETVGRIKSPVKEATAAEIGERIKQDQARFEAARTVNFLTERLEERTQRKTWKQYKTSPEFKREVDADIADTKRRLEDAYKAHPELKP